MSRTKAKPSTTEKNGANGREIAPPVSEVLTLAETSAYLRVPAPEIVRWVEESGLPGRRTGADWRFLRSAINHWLSTPAAEDSDQFWKSHFGAMRDDSQLEELVRSAYRDRGRSVDGKP